MPSEATKKLFLQTLDQPPSNRLEFLRTAQAERAVVEEVQILLGHHSDATILPTHPGRLGSAWAAIRNVVFSRRLAGAVGVAILLGGVAAAIWMRASATRALRDRAGLYLQAVNDSNATALIESVQRSRREAIRIEGRNHALLVHLTTGPSQRPGKVLAGDLAGTLAPGRYASYYVLDATGRVRAASGDFGEGGYAPEPVMAQLAAVNQGRNVVFFADPPLLGEPGRRLHYLLPIRGAAGDALGALGLVHGFERELAQIESARFGASGEVILFRPDGLALSTPRFLPELQRRGLVPRTGTPRVYLREPDGRLTDAGPPFGDPATWPPTQIVRSVFAAVAAGRGPLKGQLLDPYRDYRGEMVLAVWRWLPELGLALVTKADVADILAPVAQVNLAFAVLLGFSGAMAGWFLVANAAANRLAKRAARGDHLGQYTLVRKIAEGGLGEVYVARHALLRRPTAVKVLRRDRVTPKVLEQFEHEVQMTSQLRHPHTIEIFDFGRSSNNNLYCAMELLPGYDLAAWVKSTGPLPAGRVRHIAWQICGSLREAHAAGLLHRDLKPANIMLCRLGGELDYSKLLDFGLVKSIADSGLTQTATWAVAGTPYYVAPERLRNQEVDVRSDIYSLGVLLYYLLTAAVPFEVGQSWLDATLTGELVPIEKHGRGVEAGLAELVMQCLARDRRNRPPSVAAVMLRLEELAASLPWTPADAENAWLAFPLEDPSHSA